MKVVISLGGSLLTKELTSDNFRKYAAAVLKLKQNGHKVAVICGGGRTAREYMAIAKALGADREKTEIVGIAATHINAATFACALGNDAHLVRWKYLKDAKKEARKNFGKSIIVGAGFDTGTSSDFDAASFAEAVKADVLVNASNVDGLYTADPKKDTNARKLETASYDEFERIMGLNEQLPGEYKFFDLEATKLIRKKKIRTVFIDGNDPEEIVRAVDGGHHGTVVG